MSSPYFNIDYLSDESLGLDEDYTLQEGTPAGTPDIEALIKDYIVEGSGSVNVDDLMQKYTLDGGMTELTGQELFDLVVPAGFISQIKPYSQFKEENRKKETIFDIRDSLRDIENTQREGLRSIDKIQQLAGKSGFAGHSKINDVKNAQYSDIARTIQSSTGAIRKDILGYETDVVKLRENYIDDMWSLYSDFLSLDPERATKVKDLSGKNLGVSPEVPTPGGDFLTDGPTVDTDIDVSNAGNYSSLTQAMIGLGILGGGIGLTGFEDEAYIQAMQEDICANFPDLTGCEPPGNPGDAPNYFDIPVCGVGYFYDSSCPNGCVDSYGACQD
tara:strand:- start:4848 stop:5837 length:990 start_codon:yes stop_codon:yes gene_type:complete